jgi:hypothetical protein
MRQRYASLEEFHQRRASMTYSSTSFRSHSYTHISRSKTKLWSYKVALSPPYLMYNGIQVVQTKRQEASICEPCLTYQYFQNPLSATKLFDASWMCNASLFPFLISVDICIGWHPVIAISQYQYFENLTLVTTPKPFRF